MIYAVSASKNGCFYMIFLWHYSETRRNGAIAKVSPLITPPITGPRFEPHNGHIQDNFHAWLLAI